MSIESAQGIVLASCAASRPAAGATENAGADGFDQGHHSLLWSNRSGLEVRTPRVSSMVRPRSGFWVPAGLPYTVEASAPWWTASFVARSCPAAWRRVSIVEFDDVVGSLLAHVAVHPERPWSADFVSAVVTHLFDAFASHPAPLTFPTDPRAREVANGLVADPASAMELSDWAPRVGASERTLRRLFLEQTGLTFRRWRVRLRAHGAMRLLADGLPVGEVARRSGYTSTTAFARAFESETGVGPSDYVAGVTATLDPDPPVDAGKWPMRSRSWPRRRDAMEQSLIDMAERLIGDEVSGRGERAALFRAGAMLVLAACGDDEVDATDDAPTRVPATTGPAASDAASNAASNASDDPSSSARATTDLVVEPLTVVDGLGRMLTFEETPERIACRNSGASMLLAGLGLVPVSTFFEPERAALYYGDDAIDEITFAPITAEEQALLEPDLVVTGELDPMRVDLDPLFPVYAIATGGLVANARKLTTDIAALTGRMAEGEQVIQQWEEFIAKLTDIEVEGAEDVRLLQLWGGAPDTYQGWTNISDWCGLLTDLKLVGECLFDPETPDQQFAEFSTEAILAAQPTHISYVLEWQLEGTDGYVLPEERQDPAWGQLDAVAAGNVYVVPTTGHFANGFFEIMYELENYLFNVFGPAQGFEDPGPFVEWEGPSL
ncbi:MAG: helix-turn-helix domain-containing protein [Actinomycetota bacterium]